MPINCNFVCAACVPACPILEHTELFLNSWWLTHQLILIHWLTYLHVSFIFDFMICCFAAMLNSIASVWNILDEMHTTSHTISSIDIIHSLLISCGSPESSLVECIGSLQDFNNILKWEYPCSVHRFFLLHCVHYIRSTYLLKILVLLVMFPWERCLFAC